MLVLKFYIHFAIAYELAVFVGVRFAV